MQGAFREKKKKKICGFGQPESLLRRRRVRFGKWTIPLSDCAVTDQPLRRPAAARRSGRAAGGRALGLTLLDHSYSEILS